MFPGWPVILEWWIEQIATAHGLGPLSNALAAQPCCGVSRFFELGEECPDRVLTCFWHRSGVGLEAVQAWSNGSQQLPPVSRWSAWVPRHLLPDRLRGWEQVLRSFEDAPSCDRQDGVGGFGCYHSFASGAAAGCVRWVWPNRRLDCEQWRCIRAYRWLRLVGWLLSWRGGSTWPTTKGTSQTSGPMCHASSRLR